MHNHQPEQPASLAGPHASGLAALLTLQLRHVQCHSQAAQPQAKCSNNSTGTALAAQPQHHQGLWLGILPVQSAELNGPLWDTCSWHELETDTQGQAEVLVQREKEACSPPATAPGAGRFEGNLKNKDLCI